MPIQPKCNGQTRAFHHREAHGIGQRVVLVVEVLKDILRPLFIGGAGTYDRLAGADLDQGDECGSASNVG